MSEKKVGKRLLTWVLVLVMTLSLLPLNVLAANHPETDSSSGMIFDKRAKSNGDGTYTITMTAQATGTTTTTTEAVPMDIVLVLDVSGSMGDPIPARFEKIDATNVTKDETYYVYAEHSFGLISWHSYDKVKWCDRCDSFTHNCFDFIGHNKGQKYDPTKDQFYTKIAEIDKIDALKTAVNGFISQVAQNSADSSIAVVSFASNAANVSGGLLPVKTDVDTLKAAVNGLNANGATRADLGMEEAAHILNNGTNSKKVVVMFTDGEPTSGNTFQLKVANATISAAKGMKDKGTEVFTVGVFDSAPDDTTYEYMNYVSSNYPQAQSMSKHGEGSDNGYYTTADSADSLSKVFKDISQTITKPAPVNDKLDENTVITDTLSDYFTFAGTAEDVKVYAEKPDGSPRDIGLPNGPDGIDVNGKTVTVTGYDFSKHYAGSSDPETLVIKITVKPSGVGSTTAAIPTNADDTTTGPAAKVTLNGSVVESHETATVTGHKVIYDLDDGTGITNDDLYYAEGTSIKVTTVEPTKTNYTFKGWRYDVTVDQNGIFTMPNKDVTFTAIWELDPATPAELDLTGYIVKQIDDTGDAFENDTTFTVNVAPVAGGAGINGTATLKTGSANFIFADKLEISEDTTFYVSEDDGQIAGVEYDDTIYLLKVTTGLDTAANAVTIASVSYSDDGASWHEIDGTVSGDKLVIINKYTKPASYHVVYDWGNSYPSDQTLPTNTNSYASEADARAAKDTIFNNTSTSNANNGNQEGTWTFSGWDNGELSETTITYTGSWTFKAKEIEPPAKEYTLTINYLGPNDGVFEAPATHIEQLAEGAVYNVTSPTIADYAPDKEAVSGTMGTENVTVTVTYARDIVPDTILGVLNQYVKKQFNSTYGYSTTAEFTVDAVVTKNVPVIINASEGQIAAQELSPVDTYTGKVTLSTGTSKLFGFSGTEDTPLEANTNYQVTVKERDANLSYVTCDTAEHTFNFATNANGEVNDIQGVTVTITNTYYYKPTYRPPTPTVVIPDDDALGLNTTDHFAYIVGYGNGEVRPQNNITRAEVATIFFRLLTDDVRDENLTKTNRYSDVAATSWYNTAVSTLSSMGIITGYPDGTFRPNAAITRAEFAAIAARFDNNGDKTAAKFSDIATHWAKDEISIAYNNGWITGYPDGTFGPQRDITRAETMTLVNRVLNRQPETEDDLLPNMTVWTDNANPKAWYYLAVQEATNSHYYKFKTNSKYEKWTELRETRDWTQLEK